MPPTWAQASTAIHPTPRAQPTQLRTPPLHAEARYSPEGCYACDALDAIKRALQVLDAQKPSPCSCQYGG
jgi:hypothetical protein